MTEDARFEDGGAQRPLRLVAMDPDDLAVVSSLVQDAVFPITEMRWQTGRRRLGFLINRVRWEDDLGVEKRPERVQTVLTVENVLAVSSQGVDRSDTETVLSLLAITFEPAAEGDGHVLLTLAGDGAIRATVAALEVTLRDVTRPYAAVSGKVPRHPD